jgi:sugar lactone lactonase YvrE
MQLRTNRSAISLAATIASALFAGATGAQEAPGVATLASLPHGTFLENLDDRADGGLLITSYLDREILALSPAGELTAFAELDVHPVGILDRGTDIILSAHGVPFSEGPAFTATNQILVLSPDGSVQTRTEAPDALFLNGLVDVAPDVVLAADSLAGRIWRFDAATGALGVWLEDPWLSPDPGKPDNRPGANGLKVHDGWLYVSNSSRGELRRIRLDGGAAEGALEPYAVTGSVDDFAFLPDGTIAAATHGSRLIRIGLDGAVSDIMAEGCDACTSVSPFGPERDLAVLTTGNLLEGGSEPARILSLPSPPTQP